MSIDLRTDLRAALTAEKPLELGWNKLRAYKDGGGTREQALAILEGMRSEVADEAAEERILEWMDFAAGFCAPQAQIWQP